MKRRAQWAKHAAQTRPHGATAGPAREAEAAPAAVEPVGLPELRRAPEPGPGAAVLPAAAARLSFAVYGLPAPQGSKKVVGHTKPKPGRTVGRALLVESSAKVKPWREAVKLAATQALLRDGMARLRTDPVGFATATAAPFPLDGPLAVRMVFTLPKPASAPKRRRTWPDRMPDGSKLQRSTEDALTDAGVWADDARVVEWSGAKRYPGEGEGALAVPGCWIEVWTIRGNGDAPVG